ncbi:MAG: CbiX/SirB N-terminal domain-containing protein [Actinomycetota bacterium]
MTPQQVTSPALAGVAHGTSSPEGRDAVAALMAAVADARPELTTVLGFVDVQQPDTEETLDALNDVTLVPLLLSAGYHVHVDLTAAVEARPRQAITLAAALGPDPRLVALLLRRLQEAGLAPGDAVVLCAAGSSDARAVVDCRAVAAALASTSGREVDIGFLSAAEPTLAEAVGQARMRHPDARVVVSSYLVAPGYFQGLAEGAGGDVTTEPLLSVTDSAPAELVELVLDRYDTCTACTTCGRLCQRQG